MNPWALEYEAKSRRCSYCGGSLFKDTLPVLYGGGEEMRCINCGREATPPKVADSSQKRLGNRAKSGKVKL